MSGYIKLHRGWRDTDGLSRSAVFSECEAWLWLLENCAWKPMSRWNGKGEEIHLRPGQMHVSLRSLSAAWGWSKSRVERFLERLERVKKARQESGQSGTVLTIVNWAKYQDSGTASGTASGTVAGQPRDTQEEGKEGKEEKKKSARVRAIASKPDCVSDQVWGDFLLLRQAKRAPLTPTALATLEREAVKAGWSVSDVIAECVGRGWQSFKADWVANGRHPQAYPAGHSGVPL